MSRRPPQTDGPPHMHERIAHAIQLVIRREEAAARDVADGLKDIDALTDAHRRNHPRR